jgi:uncharacterized protein (DUF1499 family)
MHVLYNKRFKERLLSIERYWNTMGKTTYLLAVLLLALWLTGGCSGHKPESELASRNTLSPCPDSPNCVSTKSNDSAMSPLPYVGSMKESQDLLIKVLGSMARCTIVNADPGYIHAEFRSALFGFVDDVNFVFDDDARLIDFQSASRTGYYDFGVNRKRMEEISRLYLENLKEHN